MSDRSKVLQTKKGRKQVADSLRNVAAWVESGDVTAVAWTFLFEDPMSHGQVNGGMACSASDGVQTMEELGQLVAINCEENNWTTPWGTPHEAGS